MNRHEQKLARAAARRELVTKAKRRKQLLARSVTVLRKAEELMSLVTAEYGPESHESDTADSIVHMSEVLTDALR